MDTVVSGAQATFFRGAVVQPFEEVLNMKEGNQTIDANGAFFESVSIIKPETLIPENIKKGIDIGGIEGTFEIKGESKTAEIDFSTPYFKAYSSSDINALEIEENIGKYMRVMYKPYDGLFANKKQYAYYRYDPERDSIHPWVEVSNNEIPLKDEQNILPDDGTILTEVILPRPDTLMPENIRKNIDIGGVSGNFIGDGYSYTENSLDFSNGVHTIIPEEDKLFSEVNISIPEGLEPDNIKSGVVIAGIQGTYVPEEYPLLSPPTAISSPTGYNGNSILTGPNTGMYLTVTNPTAKNGGFVTECQLFLNDSEATAARKTSTSFGSSINFYANDWLVDSIAKQAELQGQFLGNYFKPSNKYIQNEMYYDTGNGMRLGTIALTSLDYNIENASTQYEQTKTYWGQRIQNTIKPSSGHYLPKKVNIALHGSGNSADADMIANGRATYNNTTGLIDIKYYRMTTSDTNQYWGNELEITGIAPDKPWLKDFTTLPSISGDILTVPVPDSRAKQISLYLNGTKVYSVDYQAPVFNAPTIVNRSSSYGFSYNSSTGFYTSTNKGVHNSYAVCRATFNFPASATITISYINYAEGSYDYGLISKVDTALSLNTTADSSSNCLFFGSGNQSSSTKTLSVTIPAGSHFIDFKYRKDGSQHTGNDNFQFKITVPSGGPQPTSINLASIPAFKTSGIYEFQVTGSAEGYTDTDPVTLTYERNATFVDGEILMTDNGTVENEILTTNLPVISEETLIYNT